MSEYILNNFWGNVIWFIDGFLFGMIVWKIHSLFRRAYVLDNKPKICDVKNTKFYKKGKRATAEALRKKRYAKQNKEVKKNG